MYTVYFDRRNNKLSVKADDGRFVFEKIHALCGQAQHQNLSWVTGKSPIPYSSEVEGGKYYLHLKYMNRNGGELISREPGGIGWFIPISNSKHNPWIITGVVSGQKRTYIGLHPENAFKGSAGCPVVQWGTISEQAECRALFHFLAELKRLGVEVLKFKVVGD